MSTTTKRNSSKDHYERNKEYYKEYYRQYNIDNSGTLKAQKREYYHKNKQVLNKKTTEYIQTHPANRLLASAKNRAVKKGLEFTITLDDVIIPATCPYLGTPITSLFGEGRTKTNPSLDRIDNSKGYVSGNVEVISSKANLMKSDASKEELIQFAKSILKKYA